MRSLTFSSLVQGMAQTLPLCFQQQPVTFFQLSLAVQQVLQQTSFPTATRREAFNGNPSASSQVGDRLAEGVFCLVKQCSKPYDHLCFVVFYPPPPKLAPDNCPCSPGWPCSPSAATCPARIGAVFDSWDAAEKPKIRLKTCWLSVITHGLEMNPGIGPLQENHLDCL